MDLLQEVVGDLGRQPAGLLSRLPVAGVRCAGGQRLTVRQDVPDEEGRGDGPLLGHLRVLQVRRQPRAVTRCRRVLRALPAGRRGRRAAALRVGPGAEVQRGAAPCVPGLGQRTPGPVGQQRVDTEAGAVVGGRLHGSGRGLS